MPIDRNEEFPEVERPSGRGRRRLLLALGATGAAGAIMVVSAAGTTSTAGAAANTKFFVCKYVGTPGVDERLQTGQNPIDVSRHAIKEKPVVVGSFFNDKQGRSFVLAKDVGQPEPPVTDCPPPSGPTGTPTPTPTPTTPTPTPTTTPPTTSTTPPPPPSSSQGNSAVSQGPIPGGVNAGQHTPVQNFGLQAWGIVLMLLAGVGGLVVGIWPTRRPRAH